MACLFRRFRSSAESAKLKVSLAAVRIIQGGFRRHLRRAKLAATRAMADEQARMDDKLLGLKEQVAATAQDMPEIPQADDASARTINETLLEEVEG